MKVKPDSEAHFPHRKEEILNSLSHGIGALLAIWGLFAMLAKNFGKTEFSIWGILIYSATLITMLSISAVYHITKNPKIKRAFRVLDHINIYFLIAGTYTPVALITLINENGWVIFFAVWSIAGLGTIFKLFYTGKYEFISLLIYIAMGWLIVFDFENLLEQTSSMGIQLLFLGGAFYTLGIFFYAWERIPYNHLIWHIFVLAGAISHWFFIYFDVV